MNNLLANLWRVVVPLWRIGNYWVRWAIAIVASWPILIALAGLVGWPALTATVALLPLVAIVCGLIAIFDPLVLATLAPFRIGRTVLSGLAAIIGLELSVGVYFAAVPVASDRGLVPLTLVAILAVLFLAISVGKIARIAVVFPLGVLAVLTTIFLVGGREEASRRIEAARVGGGSTPGAYSTLVVGERDEKEVVLPPRSWFDVSSDKPIVIRLTNGAVFEKDPGGTLYKKLPNGTLAAVASLGDEIPGSVIYIRAKENEKMARVTITTVRK